MSRAQVLFLAFKLPSMALRRDRFETGSVQNLSHFLSRAVGSILLAATLISCAPTSAVLEDGSEIVGGRDASTMMKDSDDPTVSPGIADTVADRKTTEPYGPPPRDLVYYYYGSVLRNLVAEDPSSLDFANCRPDESQCCSRFFHGDDDLLDWMSRRKLDVSDERSCPELYQVQGRAGEKRLLVLICRKNSSFSVLSTYRESDVDGLNINCQDWVQ